MRAESLQRADAARLADGGLIWNQIRRSGHQADASELKGSRWVLLKNAQDLTPHQAAKLAVVAKLNAPLHRAYLLKEQLRMVFHVGYDEAIRSLERWLRSARRCRAQGHHS